MAEQVKVFEDNFFSKEIKTNVPRSLFNLSHIHSTTAKFGELFPFYIQDCVPNDTHELTQVVKLQSLPMATPNFTAWKLKTWYFYVPYYLLWHKFDRFIFGGRDGKFTATPPIIGDPNNGVTFNKGSLADHLGFPVGVAIPPDDCPSAFPFMAYLRIYRDYFLNQDIQTSSNVNDWFPADDFDFQLADGFQTAIGSLNLGDLRFKNYVNDYFVSAMLWPQRGDPIAMPITGNAGVVANDTDSISVLNDHAGSTKMAGLTHSLNFVAGSQVILNNPVTPGNSDTTRVYASLRNSAGFSIEDLRLNLRMQEWLERNMRTKAQYNESLRIHFDDAPVDLRLTKPYYIGGTSQIINQSEVLQTSESTNSSAQGTLTANSHLLDTNSIDRFHSHEYGMIMGVACIMPDTMYTQGIDREWSKRTRYDYYFPEFADLCPQGIHNRELFVSTSASTNKAIFGYQGRFDEMRHRRNMVTGELRDPNSSDFFSWTSARYFTSTPTLDSTFINSNGTVRYDIFPSGSSVPPFILQFGIGDRAVRPLPIQNVPVGLL